MTECERDKNDGERDSETQAPRETDRQQTNRQRRLRNRGLERLKCVRGKRLTFHKLVCLQRGMNNFYLTKQQNSN